MNYIIRELLYWGIGIKHRLCSDHLKMGFRAKASINAVFEGYNKLADHSFFDAGKLGFASYIGEKSIVGGLIGRYCSIGGNVIFLTNTHPTSGFVSSHPCFYSTKRQSGFSYVREQKFDEAPKLEDSQYSIVVGNDVYIGYGVTVVGPVKIGDGAVIAANSTVTRDVEPYSIVGGSPARLLKKRFSDDDIDFLMKLKWWDRSSEWIEKYAEYFCSVSDLRKVLEEKDEC